jgi:hypothetical protein
LSVPLIQNFLNHRLEQGDSVRKVQMMRTVLNAALTRALREELIIWNAARLVELPSAVLRSDQVGRPRLAGC